MSLAELSKLSPRVEHQVPLAANYRSPETGTYYTPAIYRVERLNGKLVTCRVALIPQSTPIDTGGPGDAGVLFNMLKMGVRFRWEVVETMLIRLPPKTTTFRSEQ